MDDGVQAVVRSHEGSAGGAAGVERRGHTEGDERNVEKRCYRVLCERKHTPQTAHEK